VIFCSSSTFSTISTISTKREKERKEQKERKREKLYYDGIYTYTITTTTIHINYKKIYINYRELLREKNGI
jgi:hypothetical protein